MKLTYNFPEQAGKGRAAGAAKHLEFPAGGDQRVIVTKVGTIKAQHLNTIIYRSITTCMVIEVLGGSVGGNRKKAPR